MGIATIEQPSHRMTGLDGIRGIAALVVVFNHIYNFIPALAVDSSFLFNYTPAYFLIAGRIAVIIFFILSGFVLSLPYYNGTSQSYSAYAVRRFCRIYLPFLAVLIGAIGLHAAFADQNLVIEGARTWSAPLSWSVIASHIFMTGITEDSIRLNFPMWTLIMEMRVSLILPLLVIFISRFSWSGVVIGAVIGVAATKIVAGMEGFDDHVALSITGTMLLTVYYISFFLFGILIAKKLEFLKSVMRRIPVVLHALAYLGILLMPRVILKDHYLAQELWYALVGSYLILCCLSFTGFNAAMSVRPIMWLGRVSYSLYLVHMPLLTAAMYVLNGVLPLPVILAVAFIAILIVAEFVHVLVEKPSIVWGKKLSRRLEKKREAA